MSPPRRVLRAWDHITIYIPVILMGVLALGTYWLARTTPTFAPSSPDRPATHEPDYFLRGFSVRAFDPGGRLKNELKGVEARHYPDTDTMEVDEPRLRSFSQDGALLTARAKKGISNADGTQVQLIGDAIVTRVPPPAQRASEPAMEIRGEFLHAFMDTERLKSHKPVTLTRGGNVFHADAGMDYDNQKRVLELTGNVRGTLQPPAP